MKQTLQKVEYYTSTMYLQKENIGDSKSAIKLIENITEKPQWFNADGTPMQKGAGIDSMMKGYKKGDNGSRRQMEAYSQVFHDTNASPAWNGSMGIEQVIEQSIIEGGKSYNHVYGTEMRKPTIGDTVSIQVWAWYEPEQQIQGRKTRKFLITENGFKEYNFSDGGFI